MSAHRFLTAVILALATCLSTAAQQPTFQSQVDVIPIDVTIVDGRGQPVEGLTAADFTVRIDGQPRRVVSAEWTSLVSSRPETAAPAPRVPEGFSSNEQSPTGRLILIAIDQPNLGFTAVRPLQPTLNTFIDRLPATDRIAVVGLGYGSPSMSFTADRERVKQAITRMPGQRSNDNSSHEIDTGAALSIERNGEASRAFDALVLRDCPSGNSPSDRQERDACKQDIKAEAAGIAVATRQRADLTMDGLRNLLKAVKGIDAPKALVIVSQGFFADQDRDNGARITELGALAAAARTSIYAVKVDEETDMSRARAPGTAADDRLLERLGLESLAIAARGALFNLSGTGNGIFERIASELSGYYLLAVEPDARDRNGKSHSIAVDVARRGVTVRARRVSIVGTEAAALAVSSRDIVADAINMPVLLSSLPIRAIAYSLRGPDASKLQLLIHAEFGSAYTAPARMSIAFAVLDAQGRAVDGQFSETRLAPAAIGVPSPLPYVAGASVAPGTYTVKLAAADGDRVGSIEVPVRASLMDAGSVKLTELMAGGPVPPGNLLQPTIGSRVSFGSVHGYLEAYGPEAASLSVRYEVAADEKGPSLITADVPARTAGDERALFSEMIVVQSLPPGDYRLRAVISRGETPITTLTRAFEIGSAPGASTPPAAALLLDVAIAVEAKDLTPPFRRDDAVKAATLEPFRSRLRRDTQPAFDRGVSYLQRGEYADAETSFRTALRQDPESAAALVYLAACLAAAGYDADAASAWRTALARGSELPQIYEWLGESLMRAGLFPDARGVFEEAAERWPSDPRFTRSLALLYATTGKGRDAVRTLERYLADRPTDDRALFLSIQWIFNLHRAGTVVRGRAEDAQLARTFADRYFRGNGPNQSLVKQWVDYLERER